MQIEIPAPMFIGTRLMAAYKIDAVGTIHIAPDSYDDEQRLAWRYIVEDANGNVLVEAADIKDGPGNDVSVIAVTESLMGFMSAAADAYRHEMDHGEGSSDNGRLFPPVMMEWCYVNSEEIGLAMFELTFDGSDD